MKKLLNMIGAITLIGTANTGIVACGTGEVIVNTKKINISNKIIDIISPTVINAINPNSTTMKELETALDPEIQTAINNIAHGVNKKTDYTYDIKDQDDNEIINIDLLTSKIVKIKIKAIVTSQKILGQTNPIQVTLPKATKQIIIQQDTIYIDKDGKQVKTSEINLLNINSKEVIQIGFFKNIKGEIQGVEMPITVEKVPNQLPAEITSLSFMFMNSLSSFIQDISQWDTSKVTNMNLMFVNASTFNQNISSWNTSNVKDMNYMFSNAISFNQDISQWDTSKVTNMNYMFSDAISFNQDISKWNVDNVKQHNNFNNNSGITDSNKLPKWKNK